MKRKMACLPALAALFAVFGHIVAEALATGRNVLSVAQEPNHLYLLVFSLLAVPLWARAVRARRLEIALFIFTALSLAVDGSILGVGALAAAILICAVLCWIGGSAVQAMADSQARSPQHVSARPKPQAFSAGIEPPGPYYAYLASRGNRPPPLARSV